MQDPSLKPASLPAPPFTLRRTARRAGHVRVTLTLHLHEAADPERRTQRLSYTVELQVGLGARESVQQQRFEFLTQEVEYGGRAGAHGAPAATDSQAAAIARVEEEEEEAAVVAEAAAAAVGAVPQASAKPALALGCPPGSPQQQSKKQRVT